MPVVIDPRITDQSPDQSVKSITYNNQLRVLISTVLILLGVSIVLYQVLPLAVSFINGKFLESSAKEIKSPVPESLLSKALTAQYYDPGLSYFQNLIAVSGGSVLAANNGFTEQKAVTINENYNKKMFVSVPSANINHIQITPNVNSYEKKVYDQALKHGVAHFKGTPVPGDGGNSFIYGHSGLSNIFQRVNRPQLIFSRLEKVKIGDIIKIEKEGQTLKYIVTKKKLVAESDSTVLNSNSYKETVTLMTCWPLGIGTQRLVVMGEKE